MATLAEIGFSVRNQVRGGFSPDDERLDIELVYHIVNNARVLAIREWYESKKRFDASLYQTVCCLEIKCREVECKGIKSGDIEYYIDTLPDIMDLPNTIAYFGTVDRLTPFRQVPAVGIFAIGESQYAPDAPSFVHIEDEFILYNLPTEGMKFACLTSVNNNPIDLGCYKAKEDEDYPVPGHLIHKIELLAIKQLLSTPVTNPKMLPDEMNNARNDI